MNCTLDSAILTALTTSRTVYLPSLSMISLTFQTLFLPVAVTGPDMEILFA